MADYLINWPFCSDISLDLMKSYEVRKVGDQSNHRYEKKTAFDIKLE